jgi:hypothetical protein
MTANERHAIIAARGWRIAAALATLVTAAVLALAIAHWTWQLIGPAPVYIPPAQPADPASTIVAGALFGSASREAAAPTATDSLGDVRLLGIVARRDGSGYALFRVPAGPRFVATGEDVVPGLRLNAVRNDGVTLSDPSGDRTLALRTAAPRAAPATPAPTPAPRAAPAAASGGLNVASNAASKCQPPAGFNGEVVRLNVELVGGLIAQPETWRAMVQPANGALVVRETGGFGQMIGLMQGDRVEQANGIPLTIPDDVVGAVLRPLASNQPVRLVGSRNGQRRELWIANAGCGG